MKEIVLMVRRKEDGGIEVTGPLADKVLCLGLLEIAKITVNEFKPMVEPAKAPVDLRSLK